MVIVWARSRAGLFPIHSAFPDPGPGRRPHCSFRGLLELYSRYGPPDCSPTMRGLCREVSISTVTSAHRSPAIESNHQLFEWVLPPLVFSPRGAHAGLPAPQSGRPQRVRASFGAMGAAGRPIANRPQVANRLPTCPTIESSRRAKKLMDSSTTGETRRSVTNRMRNLRYRLPARARERSVAQDAARKPRINCSSRFRRHRAHTQLRNRHERENQFGAAQSV